MDEYERLLRNLEIMRDTAFEEARNNRLKGETLDHTAMLLRDVIRAEKDKEAAIIADAIDEAMKAEK